MLWLGPERYVPISATVRGQTMRLRGVDTVRIQYRFFRHPTINLPLLPLTFFVWRPEQLIRYWLICTPISRCGGRNGLNVGLRCDGTG